MTIDRRSVVKGLVACSLAGPFLGRGATAQAGTVVRPTASGPTTILVPPGTADSAFMHGVRTGIGTAASSVHETSHDLAFLLAFERALRDGHGPRVIALLDDAVATLVLDLARTAGARVPWIGHHARGASGARRHRLSATPSMDHCVAQFERGLAMRGNVTAPDADAIDDAGHWAAALGCLLAAPGRCDPASMPDSLAARTPLAGSLVSFVIES